jgi:parallel beta-helix repeat protein
MIMNRITELIIVAGICCATGLQAGTYIVDTQHPQAADTNAGTREAPLKTISAGAARAVAGDTVLVRPGLYRESVPLTNSGAPGRPIVFRSEEPRAAVLCGSDVITNWQAAGPGVWMTAIAPVVSNKWALPHGERGGHWLYGNDTPLQYEEDRTRQMPGTFHIDRDARRLYVAPDEGQTPGDITFEYAYRDGLFAAPEALDDIHIIGFALRHNACWFRGRPAVRARGRRWLIENNHVLWTSYTPGITTDNTSDAVVRGNLVEWCGSQGLGGSCSQGMLVESNVVRYCNWRRGDPSSAAAGGSKWAFTYDSIIRGNVFAFNHGSGLWCDWANANNLHENNVCHDNSAWGLFAEANWDETFRDNISFNNSQGITIAESIGCTAVRNIVFNNEYGIMLRGIYNRSHGAGYTPEGAAQVERILDRVPDLAPIDRLRLRNGFLKYHQAVEKFMSNNSVLWDNLLFDNAAALWEGRDYGTPSALDPFVNNFSDFNWFYVSTNRVGAWAAPVLMLHRAGAYDTLAAWQRVSGRDARSHELPVHPRVATNLPAWAEARRSQWDLPLRRHEETRTLGLIDGPSRCIAQGRWLRSSTIEALPLSDSQIKAYILDVEGERTLMLWTCHEMARRYVRLALEQDEITVENGTLQRQKRALPARAIDLVVNWQPLYLRGLRGTVREVPAVALSVAPFNAPDRPVPAKITVPNPTKTPVEFEATISLSGGFAVRPARIRCTVPPGGTVPVDVEFVPDGSVRRGSSSVRMEGSLGGERVSRIARFSVGEAGGTVPRAGGAVQVDGRLGDWPTVSSAVPALGLINEASQFAVGKLEAWQGTNDLSGKVYAMWTTQALYVAVTVADDRFVPLPAPANPWDGDCVEVFFDGRSGDMQWQVPPTEGCYQIAVAAGIGTNAVNVVTWSQSAPRPLPGLVVASATNATGYTVEMAIPLTLRNFPAGEWAAGRPVKLSVLLYDRDDKRASTKYTFGWSFSPDGANFRDTSGWRTLVLE